MLRSEDKRYEKSFLNHVPKSKSIKIKNIKKKKKFINIIFKYFKIVNLSLI